MKIILVTTDYSYVKVKFSDGSLVSVPWDQWAEMRPFFEKNFRCFIPLS